MPESVRVVICILDQSGLFGFWAPLVDFHIFAGTRSRAESKLHSEAHAGCCGGAERSGERHDVNTNQGPQVANLSNADRNITGIQPPFDGYIVFPPTLAHSSADPDPFTTAWECERLPQLRQALTNVEYSEDSNDAVKSCAWKRAR